MGIPAGTPDPGKIGIWSMELRFGERAKALEAVKELDTLGYGALWVPGGIDDQVLSDIREFLDATRRITIATGIINIWKNSAQDVAEWFSSLPNDQQRRTLLGIGISHGPLIGETWSKPLALTRDYLDALDKAGMPAHNICIAALGPKMTALSGERTAGSHPYLTTPSHSSNARQILGPDRLLAPEQGIIVETDPHKARDAARRAVDRYRALPNYCNNWRQLEISQAAIDAMSDEFIDALFAWGEIDRIKERIKAHHDAGADHVCLQVIPSNGEGIDAVRPLWRELAGELL